MNWLDMSLTSLGRSEFPITGTVWAEVKGLPVGAAWKGSLVRGREEQRTTCSVTLESQSWGLASWDGLGRGHHLCVPLNDEWV